MIALHISTHRLIVRGQSQHTRSYALPLSKEEIKAFGLDPIDPIKEGLIVTIENGKITIEKAG